MSTVITAAQTGSTYTISTNNMNIAASNSLSSVLYPSIQVSGNSTFDGNVTIKGVDVAKLLESIQDRLLILVPDPAKLEKYQALRTAYDHYKLLEALVKE